MDKIRSKLLVTLVLVAATLVVGSGIAQARTPIGRSPSAPGARTVSNPVVTTNSGEPDVGQTTAKKKSLSRPVTGPSWPGFYWTGRAWAAWYLRVAP